MNITEKAVQKLRPGKKRLQEPDDTQVGFGVRVEVSGARVFFWFQKVRGIPRFRALGKYPAMNVQDARDEAAKLTALAIKWKQDGYPSPDPFAKPEKAEPVGDNTFRALVQAYVERHVERTAKNVRRAKYDVKKMAETHFAEWLDRPLQDLTDDDLLKVKNACGAHCVAANRCIQFARRLLKWSNRNFQKVQNFAKEVETYKEEPSTVFLNAEQLARFNDAIENEEHVDLKDFLILSSTTGARRGDVLSMTWNDVDIIERDVWTVPKPKNKKPYRVELLDVAVKVLKRREKENHEACQLDDHGRCFVFPGRGRDGHLVDLKTPWTKFRERARLTDFKIHSLRHTVASWLAIAGVSLLEIKAALGHSNIHSTIRYSHLLDEGRRDVRERGRNEQMRQVKAVKRRMKLAGRKPKLLVWSVRSIACAENRRAHGCIDSSLPMVLPRFSIVATGQNSFARIARARRARAGGLGRNDHAPKTSFSKSSGGTA